MFVHSAEFVRRHHKSPSREISIYGVEKMSDTLRLCRLNLATHGLSGDIREANSYYDDPHKLVGRFDFVMANPPFNQPEVDRAKLVSEAGEVDVRFPLGLPTVNNANYLWINLFYAALKPTGRAGFVNSPSAASVFKPYASAGRRRSGGEAEARPARADRPSLSDQPRDGASAVGRPAADRRRRAGQCLGG